MFPLDSFALSSANRSFDPTFLFSNHQVCRGYPFCLGTYWTALAERYSDHYVGGPPVIALSSNPWNFLSECECDLGVAVILNWTDRQIGEKEERTRPPTDLEDVVCVVPLPLEPDLRLRKA